MSASSSLPLASTRISCGSGKGTSNSIFSPGFLKVTVKSPGCPAMRATTVPVLTEIPGYEANSLILAWMTGTCGFS